ncbi:MAG TPA: translation elongation factor 4 [Patescibacteria group bacterium]|nr:translation elongation factor 4 [Patescibacteria group bacterium]
MQQQIRNFCIIAHINHGKSTLADRFLEITGTIPPSAMREQVLDAMDLERERGITIKLTPVRMTFTKENTTYQLNLIDTPGHVDFSYEVSRSLAACEGAILVVDATKGIQAQTVAHVSLARKHDLVILPVINKIDLPNALPQEVADEMVKTFGFKKEEIFFISAKTGQGVAHLLENVVERVPSPKGEKQSPFSALVFDSTYDPHKGIIAFVRIIDGEITRKDYVTFLASSVSTQLIEVGIFSPEMKETSCLSSGEVGYLATGLKQAGAVRVGDTVSMRGTHIAPLPGYEESIPMVYASFYPVDQSDFSSLKDALTKLRLSDAALIFEPESSPALGFGFRCGFLGPLHADIVQERLSREYHTEVIMTQPTVAYLVNTSFGEQVVTNVSSEWDPKWNVQEPVVDATIFVPEQYLGSVMQLAKEARGEYSNMTYHGKQVELSYCFPLMEIIMSFFDRLKSVSSGFASIDYRLRGYRLIDAVRLDILVNGDRVDAFSQIVLSSAAYRIGRTLVERLKHLIPRQQFQVPLQATVNGKIIARADIPAFRKDVTAKLYGGDRTRKDKLLTKQKEGKKRLKQVGKVTIPQEAFLAFFSSQES